jgi:hypothetical protein
MNQNKIIIIKQIFIFQGNQQSNKAFNDNKHRM